jgi:hypothetical protein
MNITYDSYTFPDSSPSVAISSEPVYLAGDYDYNVGSISLAGIITGNGVAELNSIREDMISGLTSEFKTLKIDTDSFDFVKVEEISFEDSDYTSVLPYSVNFSYYEDKVFSNFFGISDPVDAWSFQEQDKIVTAIHIVSAKGIKKDANRPIDNAKSFVENRQKNIDSVSAFFKSKNAGSYVLQGTSEKIDESSGFYSITETYRFHEDSAYDFELSNKIVNCSVSIDTDKESKVKASVNGTVTGGLNGNDVSVSDFDFSKAQTIALEYLNESKSDKENYSAANLTADQFSYDINEKDNSIKFSFSLVQEDQSQVINGNVIHKYSVDYSVSKESGSFITASVNGSLSYFGVDNPIQAGEEENSARWVAVSSAFDTINPYAIASTNYNDYKIELGQIYDLSTTQALSPNYKSYNIQKSLKSTTITYSYTYNDKFDYGAGTNLKNLKITLNNNLSISKVVPLETVAGFHSQVVSNKVRGVFGVTASASNEDADLPALISVAENLFDRGYFVAESSKNVGSKEISYTLTKYYLP